MPDHLTALGFPITTEQDFRHYVYEATEFGEKIETPQGSYTFWRPSSGIKLWVQSNLHKRLIGMRPHFSGQARMRISLIKRIFRPNQTILDGAFYCRANPYNNNINSGTYSFVFDLPDYSTYQCLKLPRIVDVQIAAFAYYLHGYMNEACWQRCCQRHWATKSLIPLGTLKDPPQSEILMNGRIIETDQFTNPITGLNSIGRSSIHWAARWMW